MYLRLVWFRHDVLYSTQCHKLPINSLTQSIWYLMVFTLRRKLFLYERHGLFGETKGGGPRYPQNKHVRTIFLYCGKHNQKSFSFEIMS